VRRVKPISGRVFFRSGRATKWWARSLGIEIWPGARQPRAKVYLTALAWLRFRFAGEVKVGVVYVTPLHRFGNAVHQLGNAALIAGHVGASRVVIEPHGIFRRPCTLGNSRELSFRLPRASSWWKGQAILVGRFFWNEEFPDLCHEKEIPLALSGLGKSLIDTNRVTLWGSNDLVIHLRGGDVFQDPAPKTYGQPPLSFYTLIISSRKWSRVVLVSEDRTNPVVDGLVEYCDVRKIPYEHQSSDLLSDLHALMAAKNLVVAAGTFGRAVILCSEEVQNVYEFENSGLLYPLSLGVTHHRVIDQAGEYLERVLSRNWKNSEEQRSLMMNYPESHLQILQVTETL